MDEARLLAQPPVRTPGDNVRRRTASDSSFNSLPHIKPSKVRASGVQPTLQTHPSNNSIRSVGSETTERSEIIAPIPRRHLLQTSESQLWMYGSTHSPPGSRGASPMSVVSTASTMRHVQSPTRTKFNTLLEHKSFGSFPSLSKIGGRKNKKEDVGMGKRWVRWMYRHSMKEYLVPCAIGASIWIKWCIGMGSYSGYNTPPIFGDFEAQRHWMEITIHLPFHQWYTYDLQYWGLDYPPLTAYVSWLCGKVGSFFDPSWFALDHSRGIETQESKIFMRSTVLAFDTLIYVPALLLFIRNWQGTRSARTQHLALLVLLFQPALLLIDFGHFQYNSTMLGLTLLSMNMFASGNDYLGAFFFVLSLGFKQMALYYAPAIGSYLLGKCIYLGPVHGTRLFINLAAVTSLTFIFLFSPFLPPLAPLSNILDPIARIFPFNRGLFEDKVANFWCASNVVFKWKRYMSPGQLVKSSTALTAVGFLPSVAGLIQSSVKMRLKNEDHTHLKNISTHTPTLPLLPYALLTSSMSFFLFSFQVHEKTILLPMLPLTLLLSGSAADSAAFAWGALGNNVAVFSMWPLLKKDGLGVQYLATMVLWNRLIGYNPFTPNGHSFVRYLSMTVYGAAFSLHILEMLITPPSRYPDLFAVLNVLISTPVFAFIWLWSIKRGVEIAWALEGPMGTHRPGLKDSEEPHRLAMGDGLRRHTASKAVSLGVSEERRRSSRAVSVALDEAS